ncbi:cysteine hydrolase family protein [Pseudomonas oryzihabitans]|uniref:Nicotinamidase-related amidase n=1 Tax=Pseudomonas oryzihabitans TaxID=47885 RepID=A0AAJ2BKP7_9PSED|nr:cysteine hydrolase family protein [Pseudomonas psychrotolerans]MDR6236149.1 nicotinamidase-related amidase [Pseudomonas psychrotolerans]MDR6354522.1 nicotinamidase-related amidase [Pseudomonas psychrotolerans]
MPPLLLLIDQQQGIRAPHLGPRNHPEAELRMAELLATWRRARAPLAHVRHLSRSPTSVFWPGQPGVDFQPALAPLPGEMVFDKQVPDAFAHSGLERWLLQRGIEELLVCGVASENSVEATARSAGNLGFRTWVAEDACYTFAKADFAGRARSADEVHAMAMANLDGEYATVTSTALSLERLRAGRSSC